MGQQQILLVTLGVIVVAIAVAVGLGMFTDSAASTNRDALTNDLAYLASRAQQYFRRPASLGGGEGSFVNITIEDLTAKPSNANGRYLIQGTATASCVILRAVGREKADATDTVTVDMRVTADSAVASVVH